MATKSRVDHFRLRGLSNGLAKYAAGVVLPGKAAKPVEAEKGDDFKALFAKRKANRKLKAKQKLKAQRSTNKRRQLARSSFTGSQLSEGQLTFAAGLDLKPGQRRIWEGGA